MDYKSMLIGGLASALLFVSIGAGVQSEPTTIQVTENPYPYEIVDRPGSSHDILLNRETGECRTLHEVAGDKETKYHFVLRDVNAESIEKE